MVVQVIALHEGDLEEEEGAEEAEEEVPMNQQEREQEQERNGWDEGSKKGGVNVID